MTLLLLIALTAVAAPDVEVQKPQIALEKEAAGAVRFEVRGLSEDQLQKAQRMGAADGWPSLLAVYVGQSTAGQTPMLGRYELNEETLLFRPRFPLQPGLDYTAILYLDKLPGTTSETISESFALPAAELPDPAHLTHIYPSTNRVPENQLKFYLHFSAPVRQGNSYRHIHLLREDGSEVEYPFLELGEELWNPEGTRFTLLLDPGRIKQGLKPHEEAGAVLEQGQRYTLVVDNRWQDVAGQPLEKALRKSFEVVAPDTTQPDPERWTIAAPRADATDPLVVQFDEPLDHALLERVLTVHGPQGRLVQGRIEVDEQERRWRFWPEQPWTVGAYELVIDTILEDLAGNSIGQPFEVDVQRPIERRVTSETVSVGFGVEG